jgi:hypothetical protein
VQLICEQQIKRVVGVQFVAWSLGAKWVSALEEMLVQKEPEGCQQRTWI